MISGFVAPTLFPFNAIHRRTPYVISRQKAPMDGCFIEQLRPILAVEC